MCVCLEERLNLSALGPWWGTQYMPWGKVYAHDEGKGEGRSLPLHSIQMGIEAKFVREWPWDPRGKGKGPFKGKGERL